MNDTTAIAIAVVGPLGLAVNAWMAFWIRKLEKNTNSMKDELVKLTAQSEFAKGLLKGKSETEK